MGRFLLFLFIYSVERAARREPSPALRATSRSGEALYRATVPKIMQKTDDKNLPQADKQIKSGLVYEPPRCGRWREAPVGVPIRTLFHQKHNVKKPPLLVFFSFYR